MQNLTTTILFSQTSNKNIEYPAFYPFDIIVVNMGTFLKYHGIYARTPTCILVHTIPSSIMLRYVHTYICVHLYVGRYVK